MKIVLCKNNEETKVVSKDPIHEAKRGNNIPFSERTADFFVRKSKNRKTSRNKKWKKEKHKKPYGRKPYLDSNKIYHTKRLLTAAKRTESRM